MSVPPDGGEPSVDEPRGGPQPEADASGDADVHAFLIADVRGWTRFTQERGDEEAGRLAARFAEVTRAVVEDHRGRVVELRGDEALIVFGSPRWAIRAAVALQQRFVEETIADPSLPLTVGIGLDAGEAVPVKGGYRGGALNVAARLCSLARAGEVLASREIIHLARHVDGVRFTERGQKEVKGLDQPVHVVAVRSEDRDTAEAIAPFVRSTAPTPARRKRWKPVAAMVAFAVLAALIAVPLVSRRAAGSSQIAPNSIGVLDPESGDVTATVGLSAPPGSIAASADAAWVTNPDDGTVTRIDANGRDVHDPIPVGNDPTGIAVGFGAVWVVESGRLSVSRISPETNSVVDTTDVGNGPAGIAVGEGAVWVTNRFDGTISRIDPASDQVAKTIPVGLDPRGIAVGFGSVWVGLDGSNEVVRVDPKTNSVTQPIGVGNAPVSLAVTADAVWAANNLDDTVSWISPDTNKVGGTIGVGNGPSGITVVRGIVWVANEGDGTLSRIEPGQTPLAKVIGSIPQGLAGVDGDLWVSVRGTATSHRGGTLRVVSQLTPTLDSGTAYDTNSGRLLHLLGDGLVAFEPIGGTNAQLVPDLATSIPTPTDKGRTYTFELRPGIRYSNGDVVKPDDFRRALERGFRLTPEYHEPLYGGLVGGEACGKKPPPTCGLSGGILTDDTSGTITFHLVQPDPDFLDKLTLSFAYPVPPSVPDEEQVTAGVPGTGPYMLGSPMTTEGLALVRNPYFRVWSSAAQPDGYVDRIQWTFNVQPQAQIDAVTAGQADFAFDASSSKSLGNIEVRFAAQVHRSPVPDTYFVIFNTKVPPFDDVQVRRAMNLALDRNRVVQIVGGEGAAIPTCQQLPPNFPGYQPYCPYTMDPGPAGRGSWSDPDMKKAQGIIRRSGTARMRVTFQYPDFWGEQGRLLGKYMVKLLDRLGYRGSVRSSPGVALQGHSQMALADWQADYPAASNFFVSLLTCDATIASGGFCNPGIDAMIARANRVEADDPAASGALWAAIDRAIVRQAPYLWLTNQVAVDFVSERVGNYQWSPQWGALFDQLWVQ